MKTFTLIALFTISGIFSYCSPENSFDKEPVLLDAPDFNGMTLPGNSNGKKISLKQISKVKNEIIDTEDWLEKYMPEIYRTEYAFTPGGNRATDELKSKVPLVYNGKYRRSVHLSDDYNVIYYGDKYDEDDFGVDPTLIVITTPDFSEVLYAYDFSNFSVSKYSKRSELDYTTISVWDVEIEDNILYANICHSTYSSSSSGYNAYLVAVDLLTQKIKWMTKPLTSNANFCIKEDVIITGYGFTSEDDYIYIIDKATGARLSSKKIAKGPEYFVLKDDRLYVRTYSFDYVYKIIKK